MESDVHDSEEANLGPGDEEPVSTTVYTDKQLQIVSGASFGFKLRGEIDAWNVLPAFTSLLTGLPNGDVHLDLSELIFCDVDGIRAIVSLAERMPAGQRLIVRGMSPKLRTVITLVGWAQTSNLVFDESGDN
jgi:anti-anti-sigma regulatory factor